MREAKGPLDGTLSPVLRRGRSAVVFPRRHLRGVVFTDHVLVDLRDQRIEPGAALFLWEVTPCRLDGSFRRLDRATFSSIVFFWGMIVRHEPDACTG